MLGSRPLQFCFEVSHVAFDESARHTVSRASELKRCHIKPGIWREEIDPRFLHKANTRNSLRNASRT